MKASEIELPKADFDFFKKWIDVVFHPEDNFFKRNMTDYSELHLRLKKDNLLSYVWDLTRAQIYHMPHLFNLIR